MRRYSLLLVTVTGLAGCFFKPEPPGGSNSDNDAGTTGDAGTAGDAGACQSVVSTTFSDMPSDACAPWGTRVAGYGGGTVTRYLGGLAIQGQNGVQLYDGCLTQPFSIANGTSVRVAETPVGQGDYTTFGVIPNGAMAETGFHVVYNAGLQLQFVKSDSTLVSYGSYTPGMMLKLTVRNTGSEEDIVDGWISVNGTDWGATPFGSETFPLGISRLVQVKLAAYGAENSGYARFDDLNVVTCPPP